MIREYFFVRNIRTCNLYFTTVVFDSTTWEVITRHALPEVIYIVRSARRAVYSLPSVHPSNSGEEGAHSYRGSGFTREEIQVKRLGNIGEAYSNSGFKKAHIKLGKTASQKLNCND